MFIMTKTTTSVETVRVIAGVDTHADTHHAAVIDTHGRQLGDAKFPTTPVGYRALAAFIGAFGTIGSVGVEGTSSYGAALTRYLTDSGITVVEVIRPNRQTRRMRGKSDPIDALEAAKTALAAEHTVTPKDTTGQVEALRYLMVARRSALKARTAAQVQIKSLLVTAPDSLRQRLRDLNDTALITQIARLRPPADPVRGPIERSLKSLARRHQALSEELDLLDTELDQITRDIAPALAAAHGTGPSSCAQLLITFGENTDRIHSEAAFAALCGTSPVPASSGKTSRHRLNRGGDRQANAALYRIIITRLRSHQPTRHYMERHLNAATHNKPEIIRRLKRALVREIYQHITNPQPIPDNSDLRDRRLAHAIPQTEAARHLGTWPARISEIERGTRRDDALATAYRQWLNTLDTP